MAQINFHTTAQFGDDLAKMMAGFRIASKSQAIRFAVRQFAAVLDDTAADEPAQCAVGGGPPTGIAP